MKFVSDSLDKTKALAKLFRESLDKNGLFVTLIGDIGAGKTQFIRYILSELDVKEKVTSPSFVILNEYKCDMFPIYHFDLYRLEEGGIKSVVDELREYSKVGILTFIEWAEFAHDEIPASALKIKVEYDENDLDKRIYTFEADEKSALDFLEKFEKKVRNENTINMFCS